MLQSPSQTWFRNRGVCCSAASRSVGHCACSNACCTAVALVEGVTQQQLMPQINCVSAPLCVAHAHVCCAGAGVMT
jgi:hypothetical protein